MKKFEKPNGTDVRKARDRLDPVQVERLFQEEIQTGNYDDMLKWFWKNPDKKTTVLIDGANLQKSLSGLQISVDFLRLRAFLENICDLNSVYYFIAPPAKGSVPINQTDPLLRSQIDWMQYNGYRVIERPRIEGVDPETGDRVVVKANIDVMFACYAMEYCNQAEHIILFTGDGDFTEMVAILQQNRGQRVTVVSSAHSVSDNLRKQADEYIDLSTLRRFISKTKAIPSQSRRDDVSQLDVVNETPLTPPLEMALVPGESGYRGGHGVSI